MIKLNCTHTEGNYSAVATCNKMSKFNRSNYNVLDPLI